jgi:signal recognition particle subunit SRP54
MMCIYNSRLTRHQPRQKQPNSGRVAMLDNLRTGLRKALKKIVEASDINEEVIDSLCKDVQGALLQSDVNVGLVRSITDNKSRALKEQPVKGLSRKDHLDANCYIELTTKVQPVRNVISTNSPTSVINDEVQI